MVRNYPLFLGLSHIGQVYSLGWSKKIGKCAVSDFDSKKLKNYKNQNFTNEERYLNNKKFNKKKIEICENLINLKNYNIIFFTYDTPINLDGYPNIKYIENNLKKLFSIKFSKKTTIFLTSQVYPGFTDYIKKKYLKKKANINLIYMVDTLKMGSALNRYLKPEQLIFGCDKKNELLINKLFKKFNCKKFIYSYKEAELVKISINLYLYFTVNFSNILNSFSKQIGSNFTNIIKSLRKDKRIGPYSYINPSPSISGGHLERDAFFLHKFNKNFFSKKILKNLNDFNNDLKIKLKKNVLKLVKKKRIRLLIIGISYKKNSFSMVNSIFKEVIRSQRIDCGFYDSYFKNLKDLNIKEYKNLDNALKSNDIILYNYSSNPDFSKIKKNFFKKDKKKILIDLSLSNKKFENQKNIINFFSGEK